MTKCLRNFIIPTLIQIKKEKKGAGVDTVIEGVQMMSDCLFPRPFILPGCPEPLTTQLKVKVKRRAVAHLARVRMLCNWLTHT
jgi:hypothetical protein